MVASLDREERRERDARRSDIIRRILETPHAQRAIKQWDHDKYARRLDDIYKYEKDDSVVDSLVHHSPPQYENNREALIALSKKATALKASKVEEKKAPRLEPTEVVDLLRKTVAFSVDGLEKDSASLLTYDYDKRIYTYSHELLNEYVVNVMGSVANGVLQTIAQSLIGFKRALVAPVYLPKYKIAVGNGIFNCLTGELEDPDPRFVVTERIDTNYVTDSYNPDTYVGKGRTFAKLCADLANYEPDRIQLLHQICKAIMTGHSVAPALFIVVGRGGDGKSTFFQMIHQTIGANNTAFVNFSELGTDDKMAETINKKLVLGMDNNVNEYIKKTALLKSIASHEQLTHSRKYERAKSVPFTGTFIQLCNEMPRFSETGDSMRRRLVCFHAENSHYKLGTEDRSLDILINDHRFKEHVLSSILDESTCGYYSDFNDIDRDMVETTLDTEDVLSQFIDEMRTIGVFGASNKFIPTSHLYAVYRDWMKQTSPTSSPLSALAFTQRISNYMDALGYAISQSVTSARPGSLEKANLYSPEYFGIYASGEEIERTKERDGGSRVFEKTHDARPTIKQRRGATRCSPLEFFGVLGEFIDWLAVQQDDRLYAALADPEENYPLVLGDVEIKTEPRVQNNTPQTAEAHEAMEQRASVERDREFENRCKAPIDIRNIEALMENEDWVPRYKQWINDLHTVEPENDRQRVLLSNHIDGMAEFMQQVAILKGDAELQNLARSVANSEQGIALRSAQEFVNTLSNLLAKEHSSSS